MPQLLQQFFEASVPRLLFDGLLFALALLMGAHLRRLFAPCAHTRRERRFAALFALVPAALVTLGALLPDLGDFVIDAAYGQPHRTTTPLWLASSLALIALALVVWGLTYRFAVFAGAVMLALGIGEIGWAAIMSLQWLLQSLPLLRRQSWEAMLVVGMLALLTLVLIGGEIFMIVSGIRFVRMVLASPTGTATPTPGAAPRLDPADGVGGGPGTTAP